jgi:hypothetical protein
MGQEFAGIAAETSLPGIGGGQGIDQAFLDGVMIQAFVQDGLDRLITRAIEGERTGKSGL